MAAWGRGSTALRESETPPAGKQEGGKSYAANDAVDSGFRIRLRFRGDFRQKAMPSAKTKFTPVMPIKPRKVERYGSP